MPYINEPISRVMVHLTPFLTLVCLHQLRNCLREFYLTGNSHCVHNHLEINQHNYNWSVYDWWQPHWWSFNISSISPYAHFHFLLADVIKMRTKRHKQRPARKYMAREEYWYIQIIYWGDVPVSIYNVCLKSQCAGSVSQPMCALYFERENPRHFSFMDFIRPLMKIPQIRMQITRITRCYLGFCSPK